MPSDWLRIKEARLDITDYLIHWTRGIIDSEKNYLKPLDILKTILRCGYLKPTFSPRTRVTVGDRENTIKGPNPAVCFTEQPLHFFVKSCNALSNRYYPYAIAIRKDRLFVYGGRPVIYGDEDILRLLPDDWKYLWVRYNPIPNSQMGGYPIDWTHEREWRARAIKYSYGPIGMSTEEGVPLLLPPEIKEPRPLWYLPWILVKDKSEVGVLKEFIAGLPKYDGPSVLQRLYFENLNKFPIISLDEIKTKLDEHEDKWCRLDTLPLEELDAAAAKSFERLGWRDLK